MKCFDSDEKKVVNWLVCRAGIRDVLKFVVSPDLISIGWQGPKQPANYRTVPPILFWHGNRPGAVPAVRLTVPWASQRFRDSVVISWRRFCSDFLDVHNSDHSQPVSHFQARTLSVLQRSVFFFFFVLLFLFVVFLFQLASPRAHLHVVGMLRLMFLT